MQHFIFGYGSLINPESRALTGQTGQSWAARVQGYERHWSVISPGFEMSSVAVTSNPAAHCNGVLVEVDADELPLFDEREEGYQRSQVPNGQLSGYFSEDLPEGIVWIYHTDRVLHPDEQSPIVLSYADVILAGCLSIDRRFADEFIEHTQGWNHALLNDRQSPRYPRVQPSVDTLTLASLLDDICDNRICLKTGYSAKD